MPSEITAFPLIRTKLNRPQIPENLVARPWLLEWLSQHRRRLLTVGAAGQTIFPEAGRETQNSLPAGAEESEQLVSDSQFK